MQHECCNSFLKERAYHCGVLTLPFRIHDPVMLKLSIGINILTETLSDVAPSLDSVFQLINLKLPSLLIGGSKERSPMPPEVA